jgi:hypothetical protein
MVAPDDLLDRVPQEGYDDLQTVLHPAAGPREVDHERLAADPGHPAGQRRGRDALGQPVGPDRLGDPGHLSIEEPPGDLGGQVGGSEPGAAGGEDGARPGVDGGADRVGDGVPVRDDLGSSTSNPAARSAATMRGPVVSS